MSEVEGYVAVFKALSDPLRLRLLEMLPSDSRKRAFCVCDLADRLGISQPCLSHHLTVLKNAGLVGFEKDGCSAFYFVDRDHLSSQLERFRSHIDQR